MAHRETRLASPLKKRYKPETWYPRRLVLLVLRRWCPYTGGRADRQIWDFVGPPLHVDDKHGSENDQVVRLDARTGLPAEILVSFVAPGTLTPIVDPFLILRGFDLKIVKHKLISRVSRFKHCYVRLFLLDDTELAYELGDFKTLEDLAKQTNDSSALSFVAIPVHLKFKEMGLECEDCRLLSWHPSKPVFATYHEMKSRPIILRLFDVEQKKDIQSLCLQDDGKTEYTLLTWDPQGRHMLFTSLDSTLVHRLYLWDTVSNTIIDGPDGTGCCKGGVWDNTGKRLMLNCERAGNLRVWNVENNDVHDFQCFLNAPEQVPWRPSNVIEQLSWHPSKPIMVVTNKTKTIHFLSFNAATNTFSKLTSAGFHMEPYLNAWSPNGKYLLLTFGHHQIAVFDVDKQQQRGNFFIRRLFFSLHWYPCSCFFRVTDPGFHPEAYVLNEVFTVFGETVDSQYFSPGATRSHPNGRYFASFRGSTSRFWKLSS